MHYLYRVNTLQRYIGAQKTRLFDWINYSTASTPH